MNRVRRRKEVGTYDKAVSREMDQRVVPKPNSESARQLGRYLKSGRLETPFPAIFDVFPSFQLAQNNNNNNKN